MQSIITHSLQTEENRNFYPMSQSRTGIHIVFGWGGGGGGAVITGNNWQLRKVFLRGGNRLVVSISLAIDGRHDLQTLGG